jgi:hypothetical protein
MARKLARIVWFRVARAESYVDDGQQCYEEEQRQRSVIVLKRRAAAQGLQLNVVGSGA